jgi:VWFA-related protein
MKISAQWTVAAVLSLALPLRAQEIPTVGETIDVRVVNVETVVTNASGERVRGLTAADFRLLVDGKEVPVEYFAEVEEGTSVGTAEAKPSAPVAPVSAGEEVGRSYLIYVDDSFSLANRRNAVLEKLESDLSLLHPADRMAVLAFDGSRLSVLCPWTGDAGTLRKALAQARQRPASGGEMLARQRALQADVDWIWDSADSFSSGDSNRVGGPKVGEVQEILAPMAKRISPEARSQLSKTTGAALAALRGFETPPGRKVMLLLSGAWSLSVAPRLYSPIVNAANQLGYTVYPVDASQSDATQVTALDALARATGGRVIVSAANDAFRQVVADSGSYYWLGFTPSWKANDKRHPVTVEVRRPDLKVRSRSGFSDLSRRTETALKAESVLLFGGEHEDRRLIVQLGKPKRSRGNFEVPVTLGIPVETLALTPKGKGYMAEVPLAVTTEDEAGERASVSNTSLKVAVATLPKAGTYARFQTVVLVSSLEQRLVFTVPDPVSGHILWNEARVAPEK